jgi:integrase
LTGPAGHTRLHDVRHTYAAVSLDAGTIRRSSVSGSHASLAFTLQVYTHRSEGRDPPAAETIAAMFIPRQPDDEGSGTDAERKEP